MWALTGSESTVREPGESLYISVGLYHGIPTQHHARSYVLPGGKCSARYLLFCRWGQKIEALDPGSSKLPMRKRRAEPIQCEVPDSLHRRRVRKSQANV